MTMQDSAEAARAAVMRTLRTYFPNASEQWRAGVAAQYADKLLAEGQRRFAEYNGLRSDDERIVYLGTLQILPQIAGYYYAINHYD